MNRIYRLVWNKVHSVWVIAGEYSRANGKGKNGPRRIITASGALTAALLSFPAEAWVAERGTSSAALDGNNVANTSINGGEATGVSGSIAIGPNSVASTSNGIALGDNTLVTGDNSVAIGASAEATALDALAFGYQALASGEGSFAGGMNAQAQGNLAMAIGSNAQALSDETMAMGNNTTANGLAAFALGSESQANGQWTISIGNLTEATGDNAIAIGAKSKATTTGATALGNFAEANEINALALGNYAISSGLGSAAIGPGAHANDIRAVAIGDTAEANGQDSVSIGAGSNSAEFSIATGYGASATGSYSIASGANSVASGRFAQATGIEAKALTDYSLAIGYQAQSNAMRSIALGAETSANAINAITIGRRASADVNSEFGIAMGTLAAVSADQAIAIGTQSVASTRKGVAIGSNSVANRVGMSGATELFSGVAVTSGNGAVSVGFAGGERQLTNVAGGTQETDAANIRQLKAVEQETVELSGQVVHYDTYVDGTTNYNSITLGGDTYNSTTHTGGTKIINVAEGTDPGDAVNFAQLTETNNSINNIFTTGTKYFHANSTGTDSSATGIDAVAIGMSAVADVANSVALGQGAKTDTVVATTGTTIAGVNYTFAGANPLSTVSVGSQGRERTITNVAAGRLNTNSTDAVNGSQLYATNQAINTLNTGITELDENSVKYDKNSDGSTNYNSITLGGDTYNTTTKTGGTKIVNVAAGIAPDDAVNFAQLTETNNTINNLYGGGTKYFHANSTGTDSSATGTDAVAIGQSATASAANAIAIGHGAEASTASSIALGDGAKTQETVGTEGINIRGKDYAFAGNTPVGTVSVGDVGEERTVTNVAAGRVTATSTDAVNGSQLYAVADAVNNITEGVTHLDNRSTKYDVHNDGTTNYNKITLAGDTTIITNLAAGTEDSDAVNVSQLNAVDSKVNNITNGKEGMFQVNNTSSQPKPRPTGKDAVAGGAGTVASGDNSTAIGTRAKAAHNNAVALGNNSLTDRDNSVSVGYTGGERQVAHVAAGTRGTDAVNVNQLNSGITQANQYTDNKFGALKNMVDDNKDKLSAGISGAMAMASLPQPYQPGASMVSLGGGTYQSQSAVALGVSTISDNGKWVTKISGTTTSQGDMGGAVGVGYQW